MDVDDMFDGSPEDEVVEEEVPVSVVPADETGFFGSATQTSASASSLPSAAPSSGLGNFVTSASFGNYHHTEVEENTEAFKKWKAEHDAELDERHSKEQKARQAAKAAGREELDRLLAEHHAKVEKTKAANRKQEQATVQDRDAQLKSGEEWERVSSYMSAKVEREGVRDTSRYRDIITKMKHAN